jgi:cytoskeletal protein RodZ
MESLGEFLKRGREEAGVSLEELANKTRIRLENLRSLEKEDLEELPSELYVRGFVKLVCRELGLPPEDGLLRYQVLRDHTGPPDEMTWSQERKVTETGALERALKNPDRVIQTARKGARWGGVAVVAILAAVLIVLGVRGAGRLVDRLGSDDEVASAGETPDEIPASPPPSRSSAPEEAVGSATKGPVSDGAGAAERPPETAASSPRDGAARAQSPTTAASALQDAPGESEDPLRKGETRTPQSNAQEDEPKITAGARPFSGLSGGTGAPTAEFLGPPVAAGETLELQIRALRDVHVAVLRDGGGVEREVDLPAGETKTYKAKRFFILGASDAGAIQVSLEGQDLGALGGDGEPLERVAIRPRSR